MKLRSGGDERVAIEDIGSDVAATLHIALIPFEPTTDKSRDTTQMKNDKGNHSTSSNNKQC